MSLKLVPFESLGAVSYLPSTQRYNYDPVHSILIIFSKLFVNDRKSFLVVKFPPHRTYVATIPCETQCSILH